MEASRLIESLAALRAQFEPEEPPSAMELIRRAVQAQEARALGIEQPPLLNEEQRKYFADNINVVQEFLQTEDGADSVELLVDAFSHFIKSRAEPEATTAQPAKYVVPDEPEGPDEP